MLQMKLEKVYMMLQMLSKEAVKDAKIAMEKARLFALKA